jgi:hypothetical protein
MTASLFVGCSLLSFGLLLSVFFVLVYSRAQLLIVSLVSALFWLLSLLASSIFWYIIPPIYHSDWALLPISVVFVELFRYYFLYLYSHSSRSFSIVSINAIVFPLRDFYSAIAAGLGFAAARVFFYYGILISHSLGPATLYSSTCSRINSFLHSSLNAALFSYLDFALMLIALDALRSKILLKWLPVWLFHLLSSLTLILNSLDDGCAYSLALLSLTVALSIGWAVRTVRSPSYASNKED